MINDFDNNDIKTTVNSLLMEICPERNYDKQIEHISEDLEKLNNLFDEFSEVAENEHKYNLNWAYKNSQGKFDQLSKEILEKKLERKKQRNLDKKIIEEYSVILEGRKKIEERLKRRFNLFSFMNSLISLIDVILSIILVLVISEISHKGELYLSSEVLSGLFVFFFAFLKVTLEKYLIAPKVEKFGWKLYERSIKQYKKDIVIVTAMSLVTHQGIVNDIGVENVLKSLRRGIRILREKVK
ncbi:hypothetical protein [Oceanirhabdus sp. W0125-5]|uniref:hypothetical protein n=1 Tax=Oceanirhabdus sp. W0125-5 TaxID=2999116 RepID=UPI0022F2DB9F|nr:hypothetical protein [Oceanirhabdus sp. W0125-5]WBW97221.1 hypothetical protein OW730_26565 [Oceanirhabdus sp. W0125-5]